MPEDSAFDEPKQGLYSSGFLSQIIDRKMASLRGTQNSLFLGISSQSFKLVGDICLLVLAVLWLGTSIWGELKAEDADEGGDAVAMAEQKEEDDAKSAENSANAEIYAKTIKPLLKERCYNCHEGKDDDDDPNLSLTEDDGTTDLKGLFSVISKGNAGESELFKQVNDGSMPDGKDAEKLTDEEKKAISDWITGGANLPKAPVNTEKIVAIATMLFKGIMPIFFILILHYFTGVLFNSGDTLIRSTPSRLSSIGLLKAMAMGLLLAGFVAGTAGLVYGVIDVTRGFSENWLNVLAKITSGILLYICCSSLARLWLKPGQLNIKPGEGNNAGEEVFGLLELFAKTMFKSAPILYGTALIFFLMFEGMNIVGDIPEAPAAAEATTAATEEGLVASFTSTVKETLGDAVTYFKESPEAVIGKYLNRGPVLTMAIMIPVYLFFYFLLAYFLVAVGRAVLKISRKLGAE